MNNKENCIIKDTDDGRILARRTNGVWVEDRNGKPLDVGDANGWEGLASGRLRASDVWDIGTAVVIPENPAAFLAEIVAENAKAKAADNLYWNRKKAGF